MEEQKDTKNIWIVMTITFFTVSIVFGILLYRSEKVIKEMQQTVAESVTVQEQQDVNASADSVRLMDGMVQVQKDNEWVDYCTIEEFTQSDPVEAGKQKMSDLIKSNQDAVNAGTLLEDVNSEFAMLEKAATREVIMEPQTEVSWKMETDNAKNTTNNPNKKKDNGKNTASKENGKNQAGKGNTVSGQNAAGTATPAETQPGADTSMQQPASGTSAGSTPAEGNASTGNNASSGGSSSGGGSSAGSSSSSGGGAPAGNTTPSGGNGSSNPSGGTAGAPSTGTDSGSSAPDSGSSSGGSTDSSGGNSGSDSGNSGSGSSGGDGEDIGWTDDIL
ncbi:hypothetical protein [Roseburia inulinivorans]|uniref:Uncharacterized protein n=1 Tax=Roseburia inulinivorans TaxID=360807 RepID=A0A174FL53_9FIRM|nr:hypothetical protein [Roseburia inulinivorans]CUO50992.1 Uncharacterised protein [Roseburia inulinivorans]